jgi:hypothetical protein
MKTLAILMLVALPFVSVGCKSISVDPQVAEEAILQISTNAMNLGLVILSKDQASWEKVKANCVIAQDIIATAILPFIAGTPLDKLTVAAVNEAILKYGDKIDPTLKAIIQLAVDEVTHLVQFPPNPTDKLTADQRMLIISLFQGINNGIKQFLIWGGPTAKTAPKAVNKVTLK